MGTTNFGSQQLTFAYGMAGRSEYFNRINYLIAPQGVYSGGVLSKIDTNLISLSPFVAFIKANNKEVSVKVETQEAITLTVSNAESFIIVRYEWKNEENNYADILAVERSSIISTDLVLGRSIYDAGVLSTVFDYSERESSVLQNEEDKDDNLQVLPTEPYSDQVIITSGSIRLLNQIIEISDQNSPSFDLITSIDRIDALYVDINGNIDILTDVDTSNTYYDYRTQLVIAEISIKINQDFIKGSDITLAAKNFYPLELFTEEEGAYTVGIYDPDKIGYYDNIGGTINTLLHNSELRVQVEDAVSQYEPIFIVDTSTVVEYGSAALLDSTAETYNFLGLAKTSVSAGEYVKVYNYGIIDIPGLVSVNYYYIDAQTGELTAYLNSDEVTDEDILVGICLKDNKLQFL